MSTTDRAKRYAANRTIQDAKSDGCLFCHSKKNLTVDHLDGREENGEPANLAWVCKSCNTRKGAAFARAGVGRRTVQYNPSLILSPVERRNWTQQGFDFPPRAEYDRARAAERKRRQQEHAASIRQRRDDRKAEARRRKLERAEEMRRAKERISDLGRLLKQARAAGDRDAARDIRDEINELAGSVRRNPAGIRTPRQWSEAVSASLGVPSYMSVRTAAERIRATPPATRRKLAAAMRPNPAQIPSYGQYKYAVSMYQHGKGDPAFRAVIDRVPKARQREYARAIWGERYEHGTEHQTGAYRSAVPF